MEWKPIKDVDELWMELDEVERSSSSRLKQKLIVLHKVRKGYNLITTRKEKEKRKGQKQKQKQKQIDTHKTAPKQPTQPLRIKI